MYTGNISMLIPVYIYNYAVSIHDDLRKIKHMMNHPGLEKTEKI